MQDCFVNSKHKADLCNTKRWNHENLSFATDLKISLWHGGGGGEPEKRKPDSVTFNQCLGIVLFEVTRHRFCVISNYDNVNVSVPDTVSDISNKPSDAV